jgi:hypothetical protein
VKIFGFCGKRNSPAGNDSAYPCEGTLSGKTTIIKGIFAWNYHRDIEHHCKAEWLPLRAINKVGRPARHLNRPPGVITHPRINRTYGQSKQTVLIGVFVLVGVGVRVGVLVGVIPEVGVGVRVGEFVAVGVLVGVKVLDAVLVGVLVRVAVNVSVGV